MNKKIFFLFFIFFIISSYSATAFFTFDHAYWNIKTSELVDSAFMNKCRDKLDIIIDGNFAMDIPVIHYNDEQVLSYIFTHTRSGSISCFEEAGSDLDLKCFCGGAATHPTQDIYSHGGENIEGVTEKYLRSDWSSNLFGHLVIEKDFQDKHKAFILEREGQSMIDKVNYYVAENENSILCNNFFEQTGGDSKYLELIKKISGLDMYNDANIICNGFKNTGFYDIVYNNKIKLPTWAYAISWGWLIASIVLIMLFILLFLLFETTWWKYVLISLLLISLLISGGIVVSFYTNNTWRVTNFIIDIPPKFGLLSVSMEDVEEIDALALEATKQYWESDGKLDVDDASGLSYINRYGEMIEGTLIKAQWKWTYIISPLLILFASLTLIGVVYKTFRVK